MPGFIGHTTGNVVALVGTTAYMIYDKWSWADIGTVAAGIVVSTIILSPDMDLFNSRSMDDWGWMRIFWWPYAKVVKHRDRLHIPVLGTLVRWLYMAVVLSIFIIPIVIILQRSNFVIQFQGDTQDVYWYLGYIFDLLLGATIADTMHFILDITTTGLKHDLGGMMGHHHHDRYILASEERRRLERERQYERNNSWNRN